MKSIVTGSLGNTYLDKLIHRMTCGNGLQMSIRTESSDEFKFAQVRISKPPTEELVRNGHAITGTSRKPEKQKAQ